MKTYPGESGTRRIPAGEIRRLEDRAKGDGATRYEIAASSEAVVVRDGWAGMWREVLGHGPGEVRLGRFQSGRASVLEEHEGPPIGVIESARVDSDRVQRTVVRFSKSDRGRTVEQDVADRIRQNASVGYNVHRAVLQEEDSVKGDLWRIVDWEPIELSIVGSPADATVGVGRSVAGGTVPRVEVVEERGKAMPGLNREEEKRDRAAESVQIIEMCQSRGIKVKREWFEKGMTPEQVRSELFAGMVTPGGSTVGAWEQPPDALDGLGARDRGRISVARAMLVAAGIEKGGLEQEVSDGMMRTNRDMPVRGGGRGIVLPLDSRTPEQRIRMATRTGLDTLTPGSGSEWQLDTRGELIDLLRPASAVIRLGARLLVGLTGNVQFAKKTSAGTAYWVKENPGADVTEANIGTGLVVGVPKTLMATQSYSRQFLAQVPGMGLDGEAMVRSDLITTHALALDLAAINGSGADGEPMGLYQNPDVGVIDYTDVPDWPETCEIIGSLATANVPLAGAAWLTHPALAAVMMGIPKFATAGATPIWEGTIENGSIGGYRAMITSQMPTTVGDGSDYGIIFGLWPELLILSWNAVEIIVDPLALKKRGMIEVTSFEMADIVCRQPKAFNCAPGADLS